MQLKEPTINNHPDFTRFVIRCDFENGAHLGFSLISQAYQFTTLDDLMGLMTFGTFLFQIASYSAEHNVKFKLLFDNNVDVHKDVSLIDWETADEYPEEYLAELFLNTIGVEI